MPKSRFRKPLSPHPFGSLTPGRIERVDYTEHTQLKPTQDTLTPALEPLPPAVGEGRTEMEVEHVEIVEQGEVEVEEPARAPDIFQQPPPHQPTNRPASQKENSRELTKPFQIIRPELNIEKHADFIFAPSHSKNLNKLRRRTWTETLPDGRKVEASLLIEPFQGRILTTKTRKFYLALHEHCEEKGWNEEERTLTSAYGITKTLGLGWHGNKSLKEIRDQFRQLKWTPMTWEFSWVNENGERVTLEQPVSILDDYRILTKEAREKNQLFLALSSFRFHEEIRENLKAGLTKPTNIDVVLSIRGELASVLYAHFDIIMADKTHYERLTEPLFRKDLRLEGKEYRYPSIRKRELQKAIKELKGKPISTGILHLCLKRAKAANDWKIVVDKTPLKDEKQKVLTAKPVPPANPPEAIPYLVQEMGDTLGRLPKYRRLYEKILKTYPYEMVYQALREWQADGGRDAEKPIAFFQGILHRLAHFHGKLWIKPCPPECKYRAES